MKRVAQGAILIVVMVAAGCSEKREAPRVEEIRSSVTYKSYQAVSATAGKMAAARFTKDSRINEKTIHGALGLLWLVKDKPQMACVEADKFSEMSAEGSDNLSLAIRTVAFHKLNMKDDSAKEFDKLKSNLAEFEEKGDNKITQEYKMALIGQTLVGLQLRDDRLASASARALDALSGSGSNMAPLVDIAIKAREGNIEPAMQKLNQLRSKPGMSEKKKAVLDRIQNIVSQQASKGKMSDKDVQDMANAVANSVLSDVFSGSKMGAIMNRL